MTVANEAVEAVARAIAKAADADYWVEEVDNWFALDEHEKDVSDYPDMAFEERDNFKHQARAALGVATSFIAAQALRDAADALHIESQAGEARAQAFLRERADELETS